jgi:hypothetical protein
MTFLELFTQAFPNRAVLMSLFLSFMPIAHAQNGQRDAENAANAIRGTWVIKSIYRTQNVQGPTPAQQKKLIRSEIVYSDRTLKSCGQSVPISAIRQDRVDSAEFLATTRVRFTEVDIHAASVMEVVLNHREAGRCFEAFPLPGQDVYLKSKDETVIAFEGVFYRAVRKK